MQAETARRHQSQPDPDFHGLWSLWDIMQRFRVASFGNLCGALARARTMVEAAQLIAGPSDPQADRMFVRETLKDVSSSIAELPLSRVIRAQFERLQKALDFADGPELQVLIREFHNNMIVEMSSAWFLRIAADHRDFYEQRDSPFGKAVADHFLEASADIASASRCYALDEWTACVFHLMRTLEHGLRRIAKEVGLPPEAMDHENWKNIIDQIEKKIREMEGLPKSNEKVDRLKVLRVQQFNFGTSRMRGATMSLTHTQPMTTTRAR